MMYLVRISVRVPLSPQRTTLVSLIALVNPGYAYSLVIAFTALNHIFGVSNLRFGTPTPFTLLFLSYDMSEYMQACKVS